MTVTFTVIVNRKYNSGTYAFGPVVVPIGIEYVKLSLDVTDMTDPENTVVFAGQVSQDNGLPWRNETASFQGGPIRMTDMEGSPVTRTPPFVSYHIFHLPSPSNLKRRAKVDVIISGPQVKLGADLEVR